MSDPTTPIKGSIEVILPNGENQGITVEAATENDIPVILRAVFGLAASPVPQVARQHAQAEWATTTEIGDPVDVILWPTPTFDFTNNGLPRGQGGV